MGVVSDLYISITNINAKRITGFESATDYPLSARTAEDY